ncbi:MAG TPA: acyl-CoA dehydrogenase, partial [Hyphomonadaceae bacterium]|nr:acyl-CoA dehydrogenase [Hyphomonadaceae bacterium]
MTSKLIDRRDLDFVLFDLLGAEELFQRPRFAEHDRAGAAAILDLAESIAADHFATHNKKADQNEPRFENGQAIVIPEVSEALARFREAGFFGATAEAAEGGLQLPLTIANAAMAMFQAANVGTTAYPFLTIGARNLLKAHGTPDLTARFLSAMTEGRFFGTMCLSEPQAGSSLADITTRAEPQADGTYRLFGRKMWISAGEHELSDNIVHMVLAKMPGAPAGAKGISLFLTPKYLLNDDGSIGARNDVTLAGLNHKMGYRGTTNCLLNFGEGAFSPQGAPGAVGYLVGAPHQGLAAMFLMMNEARIGVGLGATALGYAGYQHALDYAKSRPQGRPLGAKDPTTPQVPIIAHPDVRRLLLSQKAFVEGALAFVLYCARLVDDGETHPDSDKRAEA